MNSVQPRSQRNAATPVDASRNALRRRVLIVEPEELVRWSLVTYLTKWFVVDAVDSRVAADRIIDDRRVDAVVVSDDLSDEAAEAIETRVRFRNPSARLVRTVTNPTQGKELAPGTQRVEKPFELAKLAIMLGAEDAPVRGD